MENRPKAITKTLSLNDSGETGGHQAGILVPRRADIVRFFPDLGNEEKNPRVALFFGDSSGRIWKFNFIYYNNKFFDPEGTRNEYRLTGMTAYIRENNLKAGDDIVLTRDEDDNYVIQYKRSKHVDVKIITEEDGKKKRRLVLETKWKVIEY